MLRSLFSPRSGLDNCQSMEALFIFARREFIEFLKGFRHVTGIGETCPLRDLRHGHIAFLQKVGDFPYPEMHEVFIYHYFTPLSKTVIKTRKIITIYNIHY